MHLNFTITDELTVLERYGLTPTELFVLRLLLLSQDDAESNYINKYLEVPDCKQGMRETLVSLQNKGIILKSFKFPKIGESLNIMTIPINSNVVKFIYKAAFELGYDLFEHYPDASIINGKYVPIKSVDKNFNTLEDAFRYYGKAINWNLEKHNKIIELVEWAKEYGYISFTLASFIISRRWEFLEKIKDGDVSNKFDYGIDA